MTGLLPGFADPVAESQASFRSLLRAMSRPGLVMQAGHGLTPPPGLCPAAAAVLLTLADEQTPVWLAADAHPWLAFHCGAPAARAPEGATLLAVETMPELATLAVGTHDDPELSATVILHVAALGEGRGFVLDGPGIESTTALHVRGLPEDFVALWAANHALYPRGVDLVLCAGTQLAALPRSTRIREG